MLQRLNLALFAAEIMLYTAFIFILPRLGVGAMAIVLLIMACGLGLRLSFALGTHLMCQTVRDGRPVNAVNQRRALVTELWSRLIVFQFAQPFVQLVVPPYSAGRGDSNTAVLPILLVHGYVSNRGMWIHFYHRLRAVWRAPIAAVNVEPVFGDIEVMAMQLDSEIAAFCKKSKQDQIIVIAHSMGGLVTRAYMRRCARGEKPTHVAKLITLGTPHAGTYMAKFGIGQCARQMTSGSAWLSSLAATEQAATLPPAVSLYSTDDDLVYPPETCALPWARNEAVSGVGHVGLLFSDDVFAKVLAELNAS
jgi:triacylglycerol esterase/lipase EstA (alpha/beta hydrolase family)